MSFMLIEASVYTIVICCFLYYSYLEGPVLAAAVAIAAETTRGCMAPGWTRSHSHQQVQPLKHLVKDAESEMTQHINIFYKFRN